MNPPLSIHLNTVRRRLRRALASELAGRLFALVAIAFWLGMLLDRWLEPPPTTRLAALIITALAGLGWLASRCLAPLLKPLPDRVVAGWLEAGVPELKASLITAVEAPQAAAPTENALRREATARAEAVLREADTSAMISFQRPRRWLAAATLGGASVIASAGVTPDIFSTYLRRLALASEAWPRSVLLQVDGFPRQADGRRVRRVVFGSTLELVVRANLTGGHTAPPNVEARQRLPSGAATDSVLTAIGKPTTGPDAHQQYRLTIDRVTDPIELNLRGGDGRLGPLHLIAERPAEIVSLEAEAITPAYLKRPTRREPLAAVDKFPEGARVVLHGRADKRLSRIEAFFDNSGDIAPTPIHSECDGETFTITCPPLSRDAVLLLRLIDQYGITKDAPHPVALPIRRDEPPKVELALPGIGPTITPTARIPAVIRLEDDYRVAAAQLTVERPEIASVTLPIEKNRLGKQSRVETPVDLLRPVFQETPDERPKPGQRLTLTASAQDAYDLSDAPRGATSQTFELTVVTPDVLLARLRQQEINLRQTFESTIEGVRRAAIALDQSGAVDPAPDDAERGNALRRQFHRSADELSKSAQETLATADAYEQVFQELENNRIDNEDLKDRIRTLIVAPLRAIGERSLPRARGLVEQLGSDASLSAAAQSATRATLDEMLAVVAQMQSREDYNEVVSLLREINAEQQSINEATKRSRREGLRRLLLD